MDHGIAVRCNTPIPAAGHTHYVMQLVINPKDNNTFATASLDKTIKVWQFGSSVPNFTLEGHEKGVSQSQMGMGMVPFLIYKLANINLLTLGQLRGLLPRRGQAIPDLGRRRPANQDLGLPEQDVCGHPGRPFAQRVGRVLPPRAAHHHHRLRGLYRAHLAREHQQACIFRGFVELVGSFSEFEDFIKHKSPFTFLLLIPFIDKSLKSKMLVKWNVSQPQKIFT
jgi:hypothetical protein